MVQAQLWGSLSKAGADIGVESWVAKFWPCPRFGHLPYLPVTGKSAIFCVFNMTAAACLAIPTIQAPWIVGVGLTPRINTSLTPRSEFVWWGSSYCNCKVTMTSFGSGSQGPFRPGAVYPMKQGVDITIPVTCSVFEVDPMTSQCTRGVPRLKFRHKIHEMWVIFSFVAIASQ